MGVGGAFVFGSAAGHFWVLLFLGLRREVGSNRCLGTLYLLSCFWLVGTHILGFLEAGFFRPTVTCRFRPRQRFLQAMDFSSRGRE